MLVVVLVRAAGNFSILTLEVIQVNVTLPRMLTVTTVGAPVLRELVNVSTFADPAPPEPPRLRVPLRFGARLVISKVCHSLVVG